MDEITASLSPLEKQLLNRFASESGLSPFDIASEEEAELSDLYHETDTNVIGMDRHSDAASEVGSPQAAAPLDAAALTAGGPPAATAGALFSDVSDVEYAVDTPKCSAPAPADQLTMPSDVDDDDVVALKDAQPQPTVHPALQPCDLVVAVRCTDVVDVAAVAGCLRQTYDVGAAYESLPVILTAMHMARADLARTLRNDVVQHHMVGVSSDAILDAAVRRLEGILQTSEIAGMRTTM